MRGVITRADDGVIDAVTLAAARSGEGTSFYLGMGFPF